MIDSTEKTLLKCFREQHWRKRNSGLLIDPIDFFRQRVKELSTPPDDAICLCATNEQVKRINQLKEKTVPGESISLKAEDEFGKFNYEEHGIERVIDLKIGSKVLITANVKDQEGSYKYVNGDRGIVKKVISSSVIVTLDNGQDVAVNRFCYQERIKVIDELGEEKVICTAQVNQFPLMLAHAITITRSQGMEFECPVHIELADEMKYHGLTYTAISRVRSLSQLSVNRFLTKDDFYTAPEVEMFYAS